MTSLSDLKKGVASASASHKVALEKVHLERMIELYPDDQDIGKYKLRLADLYFEEGRKYSDNDLLQSAYQLYKNFSKLNPSDERAEYASYKSVLSTFYQSGKIDRDTTQLEKAAKKAKKHLARGYTAKQYEQEVKDILYTCDKRLLDKEIYVFNSYLKQGKVKSAEARLKGLREGYSERCPDLEPQVKFLECKLALHKKDKEGAVSRMHDLIEQFPDSEFTTMAQNAVDKKVGTQFVFWCMHNQELGNLGERLVADWLEAKNFLILARNFKARSGEIDLIAQKDDLVAFVEVKTRIKAYFQPSTAIILRG